MKTVRELLQVATQYLSEKGIQTPRLDAELLLANALGINRVQLYCSLQQPLAEQEVSIFRELIRRRQAKEPVAYILGVKEFYGLELDVTPAVLIPRPDTETLVERALEWLKKRPEAKACDVGTGSGAIAIALAACAENCTILGTDSSQTAIAIAAQNVNRHHLQDRIELAHAEFFNDNQDDFDLIVSNPPYIPDGDFATLEPEITKFEPHSALFAGSDGLSVINELIPAAIARLLPGGAVMIEVGQGQSENVSNQMLTSGVFGKVEVAKDLAGIERVVCALDFQGESRG